MSQAVAGIGAGMMQGLDLYRRHQSEDEQAEQRRAQLGREEQAHGLQMRRGEQQFGQNEQLFPHRLNQAELQTEGLGLQNRGRETQNRSAELQLGEQELQQFTLDAFRAVQSGDFDRYNQIAAQVQDLGDAGAPIVMPGERPGELRELYGDGQEGVTTIDELVRSLAERAHAGEMMQRQIAQPEQRAGVNINGYLVDPVTGRQIGDFRTEKQRGEGAEGTRYGAGPGSLSNQDLNFIERGARNYLGMGDNWFPTEGDERSNQYTEGMERAANLASHGMPLPDAINLAMRSVSGGADEADARAQAQAEAEESLPGWRNRGERAAFIEQRTAELMQAPADDDTRYWRVLDQLQRGRDGSPGEDRDFGHGYPGAGANGRQPELAGLSLEGELAPIDTPASRGADTAPAGEQGLSLPEIRRAADTPGTRARRYVDESVDQARGQLSEHAGRVQRDIVEPVAGLASRHVERVAPYTPASALYRGAMNVGDFVSPGADVDQRFDESYGRVQALVAQGQRPDPSDVQAVIAGIENDPRLADQFTSEQLRQLAALRR